MSIENIQLSIIVPFHNAQKYVKSCLDSITKIEKLAVEIICVDDGSTDNTLELLKEYQNQDQRIVILKQENLYAGVARNNGMKVARGKYITFIDADDELFSTDTLYKAYELAEKHNCDLFVCSALGVEDTQRTRRENGALRTGCLPEQKVVEAKQLGIYAIRAFGSVPWAKMFRRAFIEEHKLEFPPLKRSEDFCFVELAVCLSKRISWLDEPLIFHRLEVSGSLEYTKDETPTIFWEGNKLEIEALKQYGLWEAFREAFKLSCTFKLEYHLNAMKTFEGFNAVFTCEKEEIWPLLESIEAEPEDKAYGACKARLVEAFKHASAAECVFAKYLAYQARIKKIEGDLQTKHQLLVEANAGRKRNWDALMEANAGRKKNWDALMEANAGRKRNWEALQETRTQLKQKVEELKKLEEKFMLVQRKLEAMEKGYKENLAEDEG